MPLYIYTSAIKGQNLNGKNRKIFQIVESEVASGFRIKTCDTNLFAILYRTQAGTPLSNFDLRICYCW